MNNSNGLLITSGVKLIGLHGHAGSGKDTVSDFIAETYKNHYQHAFADALKAGCAKMFGLPLAYFNNRDYKETVIPEFSESPRTIAQFMGTEVFRKQFGEDHWIKVLANRLNNEFLDESDGEYEEGDTVIISDVRFQNEYNWVIANEGVIIHLTRDGADGNIGIPNHASEQQLNLHSHERTYSCKNNGTISDLHRNIANIIVSATQF